MKTIKQLLFVLLLLLTLVSCSFFYGESEEVSYEAMFNSLWTDYDETYALFDVRGIDWNKQYSLCRPQVHDGMNDREFLEVLKKLLYPLNDAHVYVKTPIGSINSGEDNMQLDPFSLEWVCSNYIEDVEKCGDNNITYGVLKIDDSVGYIHIASFSSGQTGINQKQDWACDIDRALDKLKNTKCIILDVRGNRGGLTGNVTRISGRFCAENKTYAISRTKNGKARDDFDEGVELEIKKCGSWQYTKSIFLLTNAQTMSAGEEFTMAMCSQSHVTQIGNHTCGVFSLALERCLANGWRYSVSVQKVSAMDGTSPEGKGIVPNGENLVLNPSVEEDLQMDYAVEKAVKLSL